MRKIFYIFSELLDSDMHWLACTGESQSLSAGQEPVREGIPQQCVYIVLSGELAVLKRGMEVGRLGPGELIGDLSVLDSRAATQSVRVLEDARLFAIPTPVLQAKLAADAAFGCRFYRALGVFLNSRLRQADTSRAVHSLASMLDAEDDEDELAPAMLEGLAAAGARFDWFRQHVENM